MKKNACLLIIATLFGTFGFSQNMSELENDIKKSFFDKKTETIKTDNLNKVSVFKSKGTYYVVAVGQSQNYSMSEDKATFGFRNWLAQNFGEVKTTSSGKVIVDATIGLTFPVSSEFLKEGGKYVCMVLYELPGEILVNGKPIDVNKIL